jgi:hypothetical protein
VIRSRWSFLMALIAILLILRLDAVHRPTIDSGKTCNFVENSEHHHISWKGKFPIPLSIHSSVPAQAYPAILAAMTVYEKALGHPVFVIDQANVQGPAEPQKDGISMIYWMKDWDQARHAQQARTTLYWNGDDIYEADIRVNAAHFGYSFNVREPATSIDLESLLVHEFGHVLGLAHDATPGSVMNIWLGDGELRRQLGTIDMASLHCEY